MPKIQYLAALGASALALAACGSSSSSTSSTSTQAAATGTGARSGQRSAFRQCLQQHGVTLPARPNRPAGAPPGGGPGAGGGGGFFGGGGGGFAQRNPKLAAAIQACGGSRFGGGGRFRPQRANLTKYVSCVRSHGYNLPNPNLSGKGPVFPASIRTDPKFLTASRACQSLLFTRPPGTGTTSSSTA